MNQETKDRLRKLAGVECACIGDRYSNTADDYCINCDGIGKRYYPIFTALAVEREWADRHNLAILSALEECLGMLGSWRHAHYPRLSTPHWYRMRNLGYNQDHGNPDRLIAALDCLEAAIEAER